jgi:ATP-dependent Clp protease ATP-binding subunit ClpA
MAAVTSTEQPDHDLRGFGPDARRALALAEREARALHHDRIGTEHLLLGLLADDTHGTAATLRDAGAGLAAARRKVTEAVGQSTAVGPPAWTERARRAIGRAPRFARAAGDDDVSSDHLLLAVLDVEGTAGQVLRGLAVDVERLRAALTRPGSGTTTESGLPEAPSAPPPPPTCPTCQAVLTDGVETTIAPAADSEGPSEVILVSCPACGRALGVLPT